MMLILRTHTTMSVTNGGMKDERLQPQACTVFLPRQTVPSNPATSDGGNERLTKVHAAGD